MINESVSACNLPAMVRHAYRMGGPVSSLSYSLPLQVLQPRLEISLISLHMHSHIWKFDRKIYKWKYAWLSLSESTHRSTEDDLCLSQTTLLSRCQDPVSRRSAVLCCYQRRALSSCFVHIQGQDQTVCRQTEGDLQPGEVQWWKVAFGQWSQIILITCISTQIQTYV